MVLTASGPVWNGLVVRWSGQCFWRPLPEAWSAQKPGRTEGLNSCLSGGVIQGTHTCRLFDPGCWVARCVVHPDRDLSGLGGGGGGGSQGHYV